MSKIVVSRELKDTWACTKVTFAQEGMRGFSITEYEVPELALTLETIEENSSEFFFQNLGVRRQRESVTLVRLTSRDEVLLKLSYKRALQLASSLRVSYPEFFK